MYLNNKRVLKKISKPIKVGDKIYESISAAARAFRCTPSRMSKALKDGEFRGIKVERMKLNN